MWRREVPRARWILHDYTTNTRKDQDPGPLVTQLNLATN